MITTTLFILILVIVAIWVFIEVKRLRHKIFAMFLIGLLIFSYLSFSLIIQSNEVDVKTIPGLVTASKIYFAWIGSIANNMMQITTKAIKMDWGTNETAKTTKKEPLFDFLGGGRK